MDRWLARKILEQADIVFVSGGDVDLGMNVLKEKGMMDFLSGQHEGGKLFFGLSAGSIMLAHEWVRWPDPDDASSAELFPCLDFAPVICDCHDEEGDWEELKAALVLEKDGTEGYGLGAGSGIRVFPDGQIEALASPVYHFRKNGGKIARLDDLKPVF